jgi:hypothetical protein
MIQFLQKLAVHIFNKKRQFFGENIFEIMTLVPES